MKQQKLKRLLNEVIIECNEINIPVSKSISPDIFINKRAKSRFGACKKNGPVFVIEISEIVLECEESIIKKIIAHELIHTCPGCYNHGVRWRSYAEKMNRVYGYNIKTTDSYEDLGLERPEKIVKNKYMIQCSKCGKIFYRQRKSKLITQINHYRCICGGRLDVYENKL